MNTYYQNKTVLITGGAGSLGTELTKQLLKESIQSVRIFDFDENGLFNLQQKIQDPRLRFLLGDIRDIQRLERAIDGCHIIFHLAAYKHVGTGVFSPFEVLNVNVIGTKNVIDATLDNPMVDKCIYVSSDKAVGVPIDTYGVSKYYGERLMIDAVNYKGDRKTMFGIIRLPNLKGSRGSVHEIWQQQLSNKQPLSVTSPRMERFFMGLEDASIFILKATLSISEATIVPANVSKYKIIDLARELSNNIKIIGIRDGERLTERLLTDAEKKIAKKVDDMWVINWTKALGETQ